MYSEIIEALIKAALADGVLTEKEKQILFKRAQAEGIDLDEFEMVLNARLLELQKEQKSSAQKSDKFGDVRKCPACGAIISSGVAVCKECGYAFNEANSTASREKLTNMLLQIDKESNNDGLTDILHLLSANKTRKSTQLKVTTITNFAIPNTKADLLDFLSFLAVQADPVASKEYVRGLLDEQEDLGYAYWLLYASCISKARISFAKDPDFSAFFDKYEELMVISKRFRLSKRTKVLIVFIAFYVILFILAWFFWDDLMM